MEGIGWSYCGWRGGVELQCVEEKGWSGTRLYRGDVVELPCADGIMVEPRCVEGMGWKYQVLRWNYYVYLKWLYLCSIYVEIVSQNHIYVQAFSFCLY